MRAAQWMALFCILFISACSHHDRHYLGYVEGDYVYLSSPVSGTLVQLPVDKGQTVAANQLAFQLDPQPELSQLHNAQAQLQVTQQDLENLKQGERSTIIKKLEAQISQAQANLIFAQKMYERNKELVKTGAIGKSIYDESRARYESDVEKLTEAQANLAEAKLGARANLIAAQEAKVQAAQAQVNQYQWMVSQKTIRFSQAGFVQDTLFRQNEFVPAGKPVIQFLPPENLNVIFFVPEKHLSQIHRGQKIQFTCDACHKTMTATIYYISSRAEYTPPVIYSKDSRDKLVYWVEAKIDPSVAAEVNPGQPVEVSVSGSGSV
ncbi:MAG: hypothetical protein A3C44_06245 [Gammaproteobacteria bacterium RIFCSPHIGHO2_02_FULL_39_13]|nr:MAG: hypothetical protein A3C44_06245 [Gammaproteobacteria bacterium RIFCSPHIGHO2_02_FULL_39_13]OGT49248.1 MAG: hypothetical protein A3E53_07290 [Gammaproteobacteria bacterium RIFCSPHIGHO2_12_FULL_39_24]